jgi:hypothetical protein
MNTTPRLKWKIAASLLMAAMLTFMNSASAAVLLTDNFDVVSGNSQNLNQDLAVRQAGPLALATYTGTANHHQVGNTSTDVGQPGGPSYGGYVLTALNGNWQSDLNVTALSTGPLTIDFDMYEQTNSSTEWGAFSLRAPGTAFPVAGSTEFGFLRRRIGGMQVFQNGAVPGTASWDVTNFASAPHWTLIFTDTAGTGSAFNGNGSKVTMINGTVWTNTLTLGQLKRSGLKLGFNASGGGFAGIDNLVISGTAPAISVTTTNENGASPFTPDWVPETPNLIAGLTPTASGNFTLEGAGGTPVLTDGTIGSSGTIGGFATCGGGSGSGSTLIYTLTNSPNGSDVTNIVVYSGWGDGGRYGQYYDLSYSTVAAPTTYIPITTVFSLPGFKVNTGDTGGAPADRVKIAMSNGSPLAGGVANIKFDFSAPPNSSTFNNGYQGYSEIIVQGTDTSTPPPPPSPYLVMDPLPTYAATVVGDSVVFMAAFSNTPPTTLQWQLVTTGPAATNNINTGVVNVTNNEVVTSTLTLNNVQVTTNSSYRLKADNATNVLAASSYTAARPLVVGSTPTPINNVIVNYAAQTFPSSTNFFPAWLVDSNNLNLIYGFTIGSGQGTLAYSGDFTGGGNFCNADPTILSDGLPGSMTSLPNLAFAAGGALISGGGQVVSYSLVTNSAPFGLDLTNITVFGGWQDAGRDAQKYQVLYSTVQAPDSFAPLLTVDYDPGNPGNNNQPAVTRTKLVPASGVLVHNVAILKFNWNLSPGPKNGWEGYSEILIGGQASTGFGPVLTNDVSPLTASDVVGSQIIMTAGFSGADSLQWKKNGTNVLGATSSNLILNNLQLTNAGVYTLVASNGIGFNSTTTCTVTVNTNSLPTNNIIVAIATQTSDDTVFTPTWDTNALGSSLIFNVSPSSSGDGDFTGGTFGVTPTGGSQPSVLTDGTFGTIDFNLTGTHSWVTCIGSGTGVNNAQGGNFVTYTLPVSPNGYDITNIVTAGGWNDGGRDQQSYTVNYATTANPTYFTPLAVVSYNPNNPIGYSMNRATITPASGVLARNVVALEFDMTTPAGENGFSGYSEIAAFGSPSATAQPAGPLITATHEEFTDTFTLESPNLIANQLPSSFGPGVFTNEGCTEAGLTDGILAFGGGTNSASCGDDGTAVPWIIFNSATGWDLTNIVVYTLWHDYGRDGQFYDLSYSTWYDPTTFLPLASVAYNPAVPHDGRATGNRVAIAPQVGQSILASNVAALKFDFTPQGTRDFGWSGYTEIVLQGSNLALPVLPTVNPLTVSGGNLILTGTGGTPNASYTWLTTTNVRAPIASWKTNFTGVLDGSGAFSNAIPATNPASFFRLRMP